MKILVINGPNINMLGIREVDIYGTETYYELIELIDRVAKKEEMEIGHFQSNHEGKIVDVIQQSLNIVDALKAVDIPTVEVHITDTSNREDFRKISYIKDYVIKTYQGYGIKGYEKGIKYLKNYIEEQNENINNR